MPRFAANLTTLFTEWPFLERFAAAAAAGFTAVECQFPYEFDKNAVAEALRREGLEMVLINLPAGDWNQGEAGLACLPGREAEFREGVLLCIDYAQALGCQQVNCLAGIVPGDADRKPFQTCFEENLSFADDRLGAAGIRLLIEPINTRDLPGFFLSTTDHASETIAAVGSTNLKIQYDVYHRQIMQGDLAPSLERHLDMIGHIQISDTPGRHEPGTGEINYPFLFAHLDRIGYRGWVAAEYHPAAGTQEGLGWVKPYL